MRVHRGRVGVARRCKLVVGQREPDHAVDCVVTVRVFVQLAALVGDADGGFLGVDAHGLDVFGGLAK